MIIFLEEELFFLEILHILFDDKDSLLELMVG
jgi:hypothetical protein